jgi:hypothetical protein
MFALLLAPLSMVVDRPPSSQIIGCSILRLEAATLAHETPKAV